MEKVELESLRAIEQFRNDGINQVYRLTNGLVLKIFSTSTFFASNILNVDIEGKILNAKPVKNVPEIVVPRQAVYSQGRFAGYTIDYINGRSYNEIDENLSLEQRADLYAYAESYRRIEDIVKRAHDEDIIFPDLLTCDNIIYTNSGNIRLIDYDGLQIKNHRVIAMSTALGSPNKYKCLKFEKNGKFTQNLDKQSLIYLYFLTALNIDLNTIGTYNPYTNGPVTLDFIFDLKGIDDYDFQHKVWKCFDNNSDNEFIGDDVLRLAEKYNVIVQPVYTGNEKKYIKQFYRK